MNDLLGSYEQINSEANSGSDGVPSSSLENQFVYMESNLVKAIKEGYWLIYVEVPNEVLLERLEKGIKEIYLQKVQIVVGIDSSASSSHLQARNNSNNG